MRMSGHRIAGLTVAVATIVLFLATFVGTTYADTVNEQVNGARIKARAGQIEKALEELELLAEDHPDDVRIHYYRAKFLLDLDRRNSAADALEVAADKLEKYEAAGGKDPDILSLRAKIEKDGKSLLKYRKSVRKILKDYRLKAIPIVKKLLEEGRGEEASYVLDELSAAMGSEDRELQELRSKINEVLKADAGE